MINSTSSSDRILRPDGVVHHHAPAANRGRASDRFSPEQTATLQTELARQPAIRPEVVERARALAADPGYPSPAILRKVGEVILNSPDPLDQAD